MAMAAALVAAIAEIYLKRLKLATLQCRERIGAALLACLISRCRDGSQGDGLGGSACCFF